MLYSLRVKNFAIIDEAEVIFGNHLNIMTGETGAGKSILIGSVNAALGAKVGKDIIREGAEYALVELCFDHVPERVREILLTYGIEAEDDTVLLSRKITDTGKSICRINNETVAVTVLKEVAALLLDIHGQHEHHSLLQKGNHMELVDRFAGEKIQPVKKRTAQAYEEYMLLQKEWTQSESPTEQRNREVSMLSYELNEITEAALVQGEDETVEEAFQRLSNAKQIQESVGEALSYIGAGEGENAEDLLTKAVRALSRVSSLDTQLSDASSILLDTQSLLGDAYRQLEQYQNHLEDSEETLYEVTARLDLINHLKSKYGKTIPDILTYKDTVEQKLKQYENYENYRAELTEKLSKAKDQYIALASVLSKLREEAAKELAGRIESACRDLNFPDIHFVMTMDKTENFTKNGTDSGEFFLSVNPGEPMKPLVKTASGGELSRIMLAFKSVLAKEDAIPTLIFDEIDTGISGRTAQKVAEKLALLSEEHQLICITHLPQIAAMADYHFLIEKEYDNVKTQTVIKRLPSEDCVKELARLLGGVKITDSVIQNATEMKELAKLNKKY